MLVPLRMTLENTRSAHAGGRGWKAHNFEPHFPTKKGKAWANPLPACAVDHSCPQKSNALLPQTGAPFYAAMCQIRIFYVNNYKK